MSSTCSMKHSGKPASRTAQMSLSRKCVLKDFAAAGSDWYWEMDDSLRFSYFSAQFEIVTGVSPDMLLGKTRQETVIQQISEEIWLQHLKVLKNHRPFRDFVHPRVKPGWQ